MQKEKLIIYWLRRDFRLQDNPALYQAIQKSTDQNILFLPIFILDEAILTDIDSLNIGYPRRFFLSKALAKYASRFDHFGIISGSPLDIFGHLLNNYDLSVFANHDVEEYSRKRDQEIANLIGVDNFFVSKDQLTVSKDTISGTGNQYTVFSPFRNTVLDEFLKTKTFAKADISNLKCIENFKLDNPSLIHLDFDTKKIDETQATIFKTLDKQWDVRFGNNYSINLDNIFDRPDFLCCYTSEEEAIEQFREFVSIKLVNYKKNRDSLALDLQDNGQTSKMSLALKWGLISPRTMKDMILEQHGSIQDEGIFAFVSEIIWREFYKYILYHNPSVMNLEFQKRFQNNEIRWVDDRTALYRFEKWIRGETGYEVVDAAMHQIAKTGWMHNRSRMIVASVLTKNLGVDWRWGQDYFRSVLLDLDEASNNGGWQWAASVGADPKPIRIFNPYLQQENYDKNKEYIGFWLPDDYNIKEPIVDHKQAREEALKRYGLGGVKPRDY
jgi:deoxyribodipyrimidine photo-lyase